jgi:hypothetical protein
MKQDQVEILLKQQNDALQQMLKFMDEMNGLLARIEHRIDQLNPGQPIVSEDEARE